jgi:DNA-binding MarR family transcriptional regulator
VLPLKQLRECDQFNANETTILADIIENPSSSLGSLTKRTELKSGDIFKILQTLAKDGFIHKQGNGYAPSSHLLATIRTVKEPEEATKTGWLDKITSIFN